MTIILRSLLNLNISMFNFYRNHFICLYIIKGKSWMSTLISVFIQPWRATTVYPKRRRTAPNFTYCCSGNWLQLLECLGSQLACSACMITNGNKVLHKLLLTVTSIIFTCSYHERTNQCLISRLRIQNSYISLVNKIVLCFSFVYFWLFIIEVSGNACWKQVHGYWIHYQSEKEKIENKS